MQSLIHVIVENGWILGAIILFGAVCFGIIKGRSIGKIIAAFFLLLIVVQCMLGQITSKDAGKKTTEELNPLGVFDEGSKLAAERGQKRHNQCLKDKAIENKLGKFLPNCAGITGKEYEACAKAKIYSADPDAWATASIKCGLSGTQGRIDDQVIGYTVAIVRKLSGCPGSKLELCSNKTKAELAAEAAKLAEEAEKRRVCIEGAARGYGLVEKSLPCYKLETRSDWEVCMNKTLCPSSAEKDRCAWVDYCQNLK